MLRLGCHNADLQYQVYYEFNTPIRAGALLGPYNARLSIAIDRSPLERKRGKALRAFHRAAEWALVAAAGERVSHARFNLFDEDNGVVMQECRLNIVDDQQDFGCRGLCQQGSQQWGLPQGRLFHKFTTTEALIGSQWQNCVVAITIDKHLWRYNPSEKCRYNPSAMKCTEHQRAGAASAECRD